MLAQRLTPGFLQRFELVQREVASAVRGRQLGTSVGPDARRNVLGGREIIHPHLMKEEANATPLKLGPQGQSSDRVRSIKAKKFG